MHLRPWPILKIRVKVRHISSVNISQMVKDTANVTIVIKYGHIWDFDYNISILPWSALNVKVKVMQISTTNVSNRANITVAIKYEIACCFFSISIFRSGILFYGQLGGWNGVSPNILVLNIKLDSIYLILTRILIWRIDCSWRDRL